MIDADASARLPGSRRITLREKAKREGVTVDANLLAQVRALAATWGSALPVIPFYPSSGSRRISRRLSGILPRTPFGNLKPAASAAISASSARRGRRALVLLARLHRHRLDGLELLALHDVHLAQHALALRRTMVSKSRRMPCARPPRRSSAWPARRESGCWFALRRRAWLIRQHRSPPMPTMGVSATGLWRSGGPWVRALPLPIGAGPWASWQSPTWGNRSRGLADLPAGGQWYGACLCGGPAAWGATTSRRCCKGRAVGERRSAPSRRRSTISCCS